MLILHSFGKSVMVSLFRQGVRTEKGGKHAMLHSDLLQTWERELLIALFFVVVVFFLQWRNVISASVVPIADRDGGRERTERRLRSCNF